MRYKAAFALLIFIFIVVLIPEIVLRQIFKSPSQFYTISIPSDFSNTESNFDVSRAGQFYISQKWSSSDNNLLVAVCAQQIKRNENFDLYSDDDFTHPLNDTSIQKSPYPQKGELTVSSAHINGKHFLCNTYRQSGFLYTNKSFEYHKNNKSYMLCFYYYGTDMEAKDAMLHIVDSFKIKDNFLYEHKTAVEAGIIVVEVCVIIAFQIIIIKKFKSRHKCNDKDNFNGSDIGRLPYSADNADSNKLEGNTFSTAGKAQAYDEVQKGSTAFSESVNPDDFFGPSSEQQNKKDDEESPFDYTPDILKDSEQSDKVTEVRLSKDAQNIDVHIDVDGSGWLE